MNKKYILTENKIEVSGRTLFQIKAVKSFSDVKKGKLGGFIESEDNSSHDDTAWVYGGGKVYEDAWVCGGAIIHTNAEVFGHARVFGRARITGSSKVFGHSEVHGNAKILDKAKIYDSSWVSGNAEIRENSIICGNAWACGEVEVFGNTKLESGYYFGNQCKGRRIIKKRINDQCSVIGLNPTQEWKDRDKW